MFIPSYSVSTDGIESRFAFQGSSEWSLSDNEAVIPVGLSVDALHVARRYDGGSRVCRLQLCEPVLYRLQVVAFVLRLPFLSSRCASNHCHSLLYTVMVTKGLFWQLVPLGAVSGGHLAAL